ncbi:MAG: YkgJ family cysteine cluster protein [Desulfobacteraceae bacterium]|nr:MAG: YkgJ family cysteine cluster protein [Desulfobacteraceae bacterium]
MKYIDIENPGSMPAGLLKEGEIFSFRCHSGLACFNKCCRNINLFLYPYDVLRLRNRLGISSDEFLDTYVDIVLRTSAFFPEVMLHMSDNPEKTCPFLTETGCSLYSDRPDTCRTFPVEQGIYHDAVNNKNKLIHFFRPPGFCLGQYEEKKWTAESWSKDQDASEHNKMTAMWAELAGLFQNNPWEEEGTNGPKAKMAFMAVYNIDRFRDFIFKSSFLKRYVVKYELLTKIKNNDLELLKFGFVWVKYFLWGTRSKVIRQR